LVSVRNAREAAAALAGGADWIDLKEPTRGALGPVDAETAREVVELVAGRAPVSAALGEIHDWPQSTARALLSVTGVSLVKLGLANCRDIYWRRPWETARAEIERAGKELAAAVYVDDRCANSPSPEEILADIDGPCDWVLLDTFDKQGAALVEQIDSISLGALIAQAAARGRQVVAAGKLRGEHFDELPLNSIAMIGVRGAACRGDRESLIDAVLVRSLRQALDARRGDRRLANGTTPRPITHFSERNVFA
jgi:uncharacterized protein (UPF0264 family)